MINPFKGWVIAILLACIIGYVGIYVYKAERAKERLDVVQQALNNEKELTEQLSQTVIIKVAEINALNNRIKENNRIALEALEREQKRAQAARQAADRVIQENLAISAQLTEARQKFNADKQTDQQLAKWSIDSVPDAVWLRLRQSTESHTD